MLDARDRGQNATSHLKFTRVKKTAQESKARRSKNNWRMRGPPRFSGPWCARQRKRCDDEEASNRRERGTSHPLGSLLRLIEDGKYGVGVQQSRNRVTVCGHDRVARSLSSSGWTNALWTRNRSMTSSFIDVERKNRFSEDLVRTSAHSFLSGSLSRAKISERAGERLNLRQHNGEWTVFCSLT